MFHSLRSLSSSRRPARAVAAAAFIAAIAAGGLAVPLIAQAQDGGSLTPLPPVLPTTQVYIATRVDTRKCAFPMCGGWFVKAVNQLSTRCADGTTQRECHVAQLDATLAGWSDADRAAFEARFGKGQALVRGTLAQQLPPGGSTTLKADTLIVGEGWVAQAGATPKGLFYGLRNNGTVCITSPCPSFDQTLVNLRLPPLKVAEVDLAASGAPQEAVDAGYRALEAGILATGSNKVVTGPGGRGIGFTATEFYLRFMPKQ